MAILTDAEIQALYKKPRAQELKDGEAHELRLRLHTIPSVIKLRESSNQAWGRFLRDIPSALLPKDKYETFLSLLTWPLPTTEVVASVYDELSKVFDGQNKVKDVFLSEPDLETDFQEYLKAINEPKFWASIGWDIYKNHINSVLVVDLPSRPSGTGRPEPYFYWIPTEKIICIYNNDHGDCEYLMFKAHPSLEDYELAQMEFNRTKLQYCVIALDDGHYRKYFKFEGNEDLVLVAENPHLLGYTPARSFWSKPLGDCKTQRENQVTYNLGALDWLLYSMVSKRHLDLVNGFPIMSIYEQGCDYLSEDGFYQCAGDGVMNYIGPEQEENAIKMKQSLPCPNCAVKNLVGAGSVVTVPAPRETGDPALMPSVMLTSAEVNSIEAMTKEVDRQKAEIMVHTVGFGGEPANDQAKNEKQVNSSFESRMTIINHVKENFEMINKWVIDTVGLLRYGQNYKGSAINYGTKFYLQTESEMQDQYKQSKENGMPMFELQNNRRDIYKKKYKNDPEQLKRIMILENIEPYTDLTVDQLSSVSFIDPTQYAIKVNFNDLLQRFERENGNVVSWMPEMELDRKVELITAQFIVYLNEAGLLQQQQQEPPPTE